MWLVVIRSSKVPGVHSFHKSEPVARSWVDCKQHDGDDAYVVFMHEDVVKYFVAECTKGD